MPSVSLRTRCRRRVRRNIILMFAELLVRLPRRTAVWIGRYIGRLLAVVAKEERVKAENRVVDALDVSPDEAADVVRRCAATFGEYFSEALCLETMTPHELRCIVQLEGLEYLVEAISRGRGAIILSAHIGNWEMLAAALSDSGVPLSVIGRKPADPVLADRLERIRLRWGVETHWRERGARPILRALANGRAVGALIDQATHVENVKVPFFGREAWTPVGPARIVLRTNVPVIPVHMTCGRNGSTRYVGVVEPEIPSTGETPTSLTVLWTERIEKWVRDAPETWAWMHDRWRDIERHTSAVLEA